MTLTQRLRKPLRITIIIILAFGCWKLIIVHNTEKQDTFRNCERNFKSQAEKLYHEVRIMCLIITSPERHDKVAVHALRTWTRHCNHWLFLSSQEHAELETVALKVRESEQFVWQKVVKGLRYAYRYHAHEADWFLRVADNSSTSFVVVENLRHLLQGYSPRIPIIFGAQVQEKGNITVGANYVLSKQALKQFNNMKVSSESLQLPEHVALSQFVLKMGVILGNSCQPDGGTFFPCQLSWQERYQPGRKFHQQGSKGRSKHAIVFENTSAEKMYTLEYLTQGMRLFGTKTTR